MVVRQDDLYTLTWEAEFGGHLFDTPIIYTDPNAIDFDESYAQGLDTAIVSRSYFHDSSDGQNGETSPTSDPFGVHPPNPRSNGKSQDIETTTGLVYNDSSVKTSEPSTDTATACEPMSQLPSRQSDNPSMVEINNPTTETISQNEPSHSRGGKYNLRANPYPNYSESYRY